MTQEELFDLLNIVPLKVRLHFGLDKDVTAAQYESALRDFIAKHIDTEDADLNAICDEREGMPSVAVKLEDL